MICGRAIDQGDASIGLPPYNGGLFDRQRTPLLAAVRLGDAVMADVIDALSFEATDQGRRYINYRDLSVQQLGSIYETPARIRGRPQRRRNQRAAQCVSPARVRAVITPRTIWSR